MENRFSSEALLKSASNYPVAKGDLPGHEFHGNQYQHSAHVAKLREIADKADTENQRLNISGRSTKNVLGNPAQRHSWRTETQTLRSIRDNHRLASSARDLANRLEQDSTKSLQQHMEEAKQAGRRDYGMGSDGESLIYPSPENSHYIKQLGDALGA